ncbi:MAG: EamA family transporter [Lachnospiraceae bacterium]|nr:EamA family transporter [Lachnospiraceae bacterium]
MELWFLYAMGAAICAALTTILAKIGIQNVNSHLATAIRTMVVVIFAWLIVFIVDAQHGISTIQGRTWAFLIFSGLATGAAWLCYFRALKLGNVNKVVPIKKSSTILTMILAFIILNESMTWLTVIGMVLMGIGTWLMLELKKKNRALPQEEKIEKTSKSWLFYAILAAVFASLVAILGRIGVVDMDANLWTALRTLIVVPLCWLMVFIVGSQKNMRTVTPKSWFFLILSGIATGSSWLFFYHALQIGNASQVIPIDRLSIVFTMGFARLFLGEHFSKQSLFGLCLLTIGTLLPILL